MLAKNTVAAALAVLVLAHDACSFTAPTRSTQPMRASTTKLHGMDGPPPGTKIVSNNKEVQFDGIRFYETGVEGDDCIPNEEFCIIDPENSQPIRLTVEEKERMFLDALQSYYASGRQIMDDAEFDALKEDLMWNGSELVNLNRREIAYLEAMQGFNKGSPTMSDAEFDALREELREEQSVVAVDKEPKCYIETGICTIEWKKDNFRNNLIYLPAVAIMTFIWLGSSAVIVGLNQLNPLLALIAGSPVIYIASQAITDNFIFANNLIAYGPCPNCEYPERVYFGNILGVEGFDDQAAKKCKSCKEEILVQRRSLRAATLPKS